MAMAMAVAVAEVSSLKTRLFGVGGTRLVGGFGEPGGTGRFAHDGRSIGRDDEGAVRVGDPAARDGPA
jgi:hypothetical protein